MNTLNSDQQQSLNNQKFNVSYHHNEYSHKNAGFTLIEVLVTLLIIGILSAIAAPSWLSFLGQKRINKANDAIVSAVQEAQRQALKNKLSYSVSFGEDSNNQIKYAIYPSNTTDLTNLWQSLNNDTPTDYGQLVLLTNITSSNTASSSTGTSSLTSNPSIITTANTPSPVTITFDYMGAVPNASFGTSSTSSDQPGLRIIVALEQSPNPTTPSYTTQRCVIVQTLLGGTRIAQDTGCTPS